MAAAWTDDFNLQASLPLQGCSTAGWEWPSGFTNVAGYPGPDKARVCMNLPGTLANVVSVADLQNRLQQQGGLSHDEHMVLKLLKVFQTCPEEHGGKAMWAICERAGVLRADVAVSVYTRVAQKLCQLNPFLQLQHMLPVPPILAHVVVPNDSQGAVTPYKVPTLYLNQGYGALVRLPAALRSQFGKADGQPSSLTEDDLVCYGNFLPGGERLVHHLHNVAGATKASARTRTEVFMCSSSTPLYKSIVAMQLLVNPRVPSRSAIELVKGPATTALSLQGDTMMFTGSTTERTPRVFCLRVQQDGTAASDEPDPHTVYHDIRPALLPVKASPVSEADKLTSQVLKEQVQSILQVTGFHPQLSTLGTSGLGNGSSSSGSSTAVGGVTVQGLSSDTQSMEGCPSQLQLLQQRWQSQLDPSGSYCKAVRPGMLAAIRSCLPPDERKQQERVEQLRGTACSKALVAAAARKLAITELSQLVQYIKQLTKLLNLDASSLSVLDSVHHQLGEPLTAQQMQTVQNMAFKIQSLIRDLCDAEHDAVQAFAAVQQAAGGSSEPETADLRSLSDQAAGIVVQASAAVQDTTSSVQQADSLTKIRKTVQQIHDSLLPQRSKTPIQSRSYHGAAGRSGTALFSTDAAQPALNKQTSNTAGQRYRAVLAQEYKRRISPARSRSVSPAASSSPGRQLLAGCLAGSPVQQMAAATSLAASLWPGAASPEKAGSLKSTGSPKRSFADSLAGTDDGSATADAAGQSPSARRCLSRSRLGVPKQQQQSAATPTSTLTGAAAATPAVSTDLPAAAAAAAASLPVSWKALVSRIPTSAIHVVRQKRVEDFALWQSTTRLDAKKGYWNEFIPHQSRFVYKGVEVAAEREHPLVMGRHVAESAVGMFNGEGQEESSVVLDDLLQQLKQHQIAVEPLSEKPEIVEFKYKKAGDRVGYRFSLTIKLPMHGKLQAAAVAGGIESSCKLLDVGTYVPSDQISFRAKQLPDAAYLIVAVKSLEHVQGPPNKADPKHQKLLEGLKERGQQKWECHMLALICWQLLWQLTCQQLENLPVILGDRLWRVCQQLAAADDEEVLKSVGETFSAAFRNGAKT